jgi:hypothetical protein
LIEFANRALERPKCCRRPLTTAPIGFDSLDVVDDLVQLGLDGVPMVAQRLLGGVR